MIDITKLKVYLVSGTYSIYNVDYPQYQKELGPFTEELWAMDEENAKAEWVRKVLPRGIHLFNIKVEVKELYNRDIIDRDRRVIE